jgi:biofilm protein TabA
VVLDHLNRRALYAGLSPGIDRALEHLAATDWSHTLPGRYEINGDRLFAIVSSYETQPLERVPWEAHRRYIDVQYLVAGAERIGYAELTSLTAGEYDAHRDCLSASGAGGTVALTAGSFAILFPHDAHRPGVDLDRSTRVRKVVVKVAVGG